jgi:thymidylate synthase ThyX
LAVKIKHELDTTIKSFVSRSNDKYGKAFQKYLNTIKGFSLKLSKNYVSDKPILGSRTKLVEFEPETRAINSVITALIFEQSPSFPFEQIFQNVKKMNKKSKIKIIEYLSRIRQNRRHRPPRAFEMVNYTFDLITNFGMFRDFHRHRALTLERQLLSTDHGYHTPNEIIELGIEKEFVDCMKRTKNVFQKIRVKMPEQAQYIVNFAYNYPYYMKLNLREATHLIELRTVPQGHIDYRKVAEKMYRSINQKHPSLSKIIKFVDLNQYELERFESEKRTEEKRKKT